MEGKKISFGFMKTKKVDKPVLEEKKEFIECVEEKYIKVVGGEEVKENTPLVIPMKPNTLVTAERLKEIAEKVEGALEEPEQEEKPPPTTEKVSENESLEQMAVRELMEDAKKEVKVDIPKITLTLPARSIADGQKESTLDDYESVPIQEFGLAMLRGMGWTPSKEKSQYKQPQLRPKGLGLGADKVVKGNQKQKSSNTKDKDDELSIVKNAFVKITTGKHSGYYGKVVSLDEDNGRVMVDITIKKETVSLSEFMMHPVTKSEYDKECKVINSSSYDEYKKNEKISTQSTNSERNNSSKSDRSTSDRSRYTEKDSKYKNNEHAESSSRNKYNDDKREKDRDRSNRDRYRDTSEDKHTRNKKSNKRYSSNESLNSISDTDKRYIKKDSRKYSSNESLSSDTDRQRYKKKERRYSSSSDTERRSKKNESEKRDIDKKRKGKKKKRDRDRSPNYRKHRK